MVVGISVWTSFQVCTYHVLGSILAPIPRGHKLEHKNKEDQLGNSSSLKLEGIELWFLVCWISLWTFINFIHMMPLGSKLAPPLGSQVGTTGTKKVEFFLWGKWLRWAIKGHYGPLFVSFDLLSTYCFNIYRSIWKIKIFGVYIKCTVWCLDCCLDICGIKEPWTIYVFYDCLIDMKTCTNWTCFIFSIQSVVKR